MDPTLPLPELNDLNRAFWTAGADGVLAIQRCDACAHWMHPPGVVCPVCRGRSLTPTPVSGRAMVQAATVNHQPWAPGMEVPYALAIVGLEEDARLRLTTRIVGIAPDEVCIGMPVKVRFEPHADVWLPLFEPA